MVLDAKWPLSKPVFKQPISFKPWKQGTIRKKRLNRDLTAKTLKAFCRFAQFYEHFEIQKCPISRMYAAIFELACTTCAFGDTQAGFGGGKRKQFSRLSLRVSRAVRSCLKTRLSTPQSASCAGYI